ALMAGLLTVSASAQGLIRDAEIERTLRMLSKPVFRGAGVSPGSVKLYLIGDRSLNAFVAGGRNIFLYSGLISRLDKPEQLQAVLAHELGHINGGHLARRGIEARQATGALALGILLAIAAGVAGSPDASAAIASGTGSMLQRGFLAYTRGEEASADQAGLTYLERAGINPHGFVEVLEIFRGQEALAAGRIDPFARTHPMSADRILLAERRVAASPYRDRRTPARLAYWYGRMRAKLDGFLDRPERTLRTLKPGADDEFSLIRQAVALHRLPDPDGALRAVDRLLAKRPRDAYYHELKGQILFESGRVPEAIAAYRRAVRLAPGESLIRASLAEALLSLDRPKANAEALRLLKKATAADEGNARALRSLAVAWARAGNEGMAALATAERFALERRFHDMTIHARRAAQMLPRGSPGWLKAQDIILMGERLEKG
ncbi:MAG: tetratricopeptide repeat protein, partial [Alphaproteobacteria bacterium]